MNDNTVMSNINNKTDAHAPESHTVLEGYVYYEGTPMDPEIVIAKEDIDSRLLSCDRVDINHEGREVTLWSF